MPADLAGKVIVLTGGADGIGRECALAYARAEATIAILDRDLEAAQRTAYAMVLVRLNRASEALPLFRKVTELDPNSPGAHLNLGIALADQNTLDAAVEEFSEAVRLDPNNAAAHYNKGRRCSICAAIAMQNPNWKRLRVLIPARRTPGICSA
jgi:NAD(P)-dependent dehydrogenase (short-subunit alcohol dehydrogenase family)